MKLEINRKELEFKEELVEKSEDEIRRQIEEYISGDREKFNLEFYIQNSSTGEVMREMMKISRGDTKSYGEIAENLGSAAVAVGQACGRNPLPVVVPCHRVVGKNSLGGYCGERDSEAKKKLLNLEAADF
jgi:methylated-DNA-[protein]-cysteine S-methyltransferase